MLFPRLMTHSRTCVATATLILASTCASAGSATKQQAEGPKLYLMDCGQILAHDISLFNPLIAKNTEMELVSPCYLIKHKKGTLLWETGISDELFNTQGADVFGGAFHMSVQNTLVSQLKSIHIKPDDIDYLSFSHLHNDHTGNAKLFKNATWLIQQSEHDVAYSPEASNYGYHPDDYVPLKQTKIRDLNGKYDLFGDGSVTIIPTPGHSAGHQSLMVNLVETGPVLLVGDLYHFQLNRDHYGIPVWNDKKATVQSFAMIDKLLEQTKAQLWIYHDKPQFDSLKKVPAYYQ